MLQSNILCLDGCVEFNIRFWLLNVLCEFTRQKRNVCFTLWIKSHKLTFHSQHFTFYTFCWHYFSLWYFTVNFSLVTCNRSYTLIYMFKFSLWSEWTEALLPSSFLFTVKDASVEFGQVHRRADKQVKTRAASLLYFRLITGTFNAVWFMSTIDKCAYFCIFCSHIYNV